MLRDAQENDDNKAHLHETLTTARVPTCARSVKLTGEAPRSWSQPGAF